VSELRWNPLLEEWVITATHRQDRTFHPPADFCPLCPTRSGAFETEIPEADYDLAVFENLFPSLKLPAPKPALGGRAPFAVQPAAGICEVIVYSSRHQSSLAQESTAQIAKLVEVWCDRFRELGRRPEIKYVLIFENKGEAIGVTLSHPHGQIYAFPFVPPIPGREITAMRRALRQEHRCLLCTVLAAERKARARVVYENAAFTAVVPFYARYPYEVHLLSRRHVGDLLQFDAVELGHLADALKRITVGYDRLFNFSFPYMMLLHQQPTDGRRHPYFHFHVEFLPPFRTANKLKYLAGCESGAGTYINDSLAEEKAAEMRAAIEKGIVEQ